MDVEELPSTAVSSESWKGFWRPCAQQALILQLLDHWVQGLGQGDHGQMQNLWGARKGPSTATFYQPVHVLVAWA